jgi:hypothetical protein
MTVVCESRESTSCALKRHTEDEHVQKGIDNGVVVALDQWQVPEEHCRCASKSRAGPHDRAWLRSSFEVKLHMSRGSLPNLPGNT